MGLVERPHKRIENMNAAKTCLLLLPLLAGCDGSGAKVSSGWASQIIRRDVEPIVQLAWTTNGEKLATCSRRGDVHEWVVGNSDRAQHILYTHAALTFQTWPTGLSWSYDGKRLAILSCGNSIIWDEVGRKAIQQAQNDNAKAVALSSDGVKLAVAMGPEVEIRGIGSGSQWALSGDKRDIILKLEWQPQGKLIAGVYNVGTWVMWDSESKSQLQSVPGRTSVVSWKPDGSVLATGSDDGVIRIWTIEGHEERSFGKKESFVGVIGLSWKWDGSRIVSAHADGSVCIWDDSTGKLVATGRDFGGPDVFAVAWQPHHERVAIGSKGTVWLWVLP